MNNEQKCTRWKVLENCFSIIVLCHSAPALPVSKLTWKVRISNFLHFYHCWLRALRRRTSMPFEVPSISENIAIISSFLYLLSWSTVYWSYWPKQCSANITIHSSPKPAYNCSLHSIYVRSLLFSILHSGTLYDQRSTNINRIFDNVVFNHSCVVFAYVSGLSCC